MGFELFDRYELQAWRVRMRTVLAEESNNLQQDVKKVAIPEPVVGLG